MWERQSLENIRTQLSAEDVRAHGGAKGSVNQRSPQLLGFIMNLRNTFHGNSLRHWRGKSGPHQSQCDSSSVDQECYETEGWILGLRSRPRGSGGQLHHHQGVSPRPDMSQEDSSVLLGLFHVSCKPLLVPRLSAQTVLRWGTLHSEWQRVGLKPAMQRTSRDQIEPWMFFKPGTDRRTTPVLTHTITDGRT